MIVTFHHSHAYDWQVVKPSEVTDSDVTATNLHGDLTKRVSVPSAHTSVRFSGGGVQAIVDDRAAAGLAQRSEKAIIARHLEDGVAPDMFDLAHVTDITVTDGPEGLREYLLDHFGITPVKGKA